MEKIQYITGAKNAGDWMHRKGSKEQFHFALSQGSTDQRREHLLSPCFLLCGKVKACVGSCQGVLSFFCPIQNTEACCVTGGQGEAERTAGLLEDIKGILVLQPCHHLHQEGHPGAPEALCLQILPLAHKHQNHFTHFTPQTSTPWLAPWMCSGDSRSIFIDES